MLLYKRIIDLNYLHSSEDINVLSRSYLAKGKFKGIKRFLGFFKSMLGHLILDFRPRELFVPKQQIIFFYVSKNNFDSLKPVADLLTDSIFMRIHRKQKKGCLIPMFFAYLFSLPFLPVLLLYVYKSKGYQKKSFNTFFDTYWLIFGFYYFLKIYLRLIDPKAIVVANDHLMKPRVVVAVAKEMGIPTFYIQHASVSEKFPPLEFDYVFLEGKDSLSKYSRIGEIKGKVFLIGMPKFDKYFSEINKKNRLKKLGICSNKLDRFDKVSDLVKYLKNKFPMVELFLRPHPGDKHKFVLQNLAKKIGIEYSTSNTEDVFAFLRKVDGIIACDSSIFLEAALLNIYPIYYDFENKKLDYYRYVRNGLADYVNNCRSLEKMIERLISNKPDIRNRTKYYCETVGTKNDGKSAELAKDIILPIVSGDNKGESRKSHLYW